MHLTELAKKIDKEENERVDKLYKQTESGKEKFTLAEIFGSKAIANILSDKPLSYYDGFSETNSKLPLTCLLYSHVLINICPLCTCNVNPSLIKPYLERGLVLPILISNLAKYSPEFIDLVIQYPYIGRYAFDFLTDVHPYTSTVICEHCYEKRMARNIHKNREAKNSGKTKEAC